MRSAKFGATNWIGQFLFEIEKEQSLESCARNIPEMMMYYEKSVDSFIISFDKKSGGWMSIFYKRKCISSLIFFNKNRVWIWALLLNFSAPGFFLVLSMSVVSVTRGI